MFHVQLSKKIFQCSKDYCLSPTKNSVFVTLLQIWNFIYRVQIMETFSRMRLVLWMCQLSMTDWERSWSLNLGIYVIKPWNQWQHLWILSRKFIICTVVHCLVKFREYVRLVWAFGMNFTDLEILLDDSLMLFDAYLFRKQNLQYVFLSTLWSQYFHFWS